jgi:hypothetical protein
MEEAKKEDLEKVEKLTEEIMLTLAPLIEKITRATDDMEKLRWRHSEYENMCQIWNNFGDARRTADWIHKGLYVK